MRITMLASIRLVIAFIVVVIAANFAHAETYPAKPVRLIVGLAVGGGTDALARLIAQRLRESLGQPVIVENRTGSDGDIAAALVAGSKPDGHTLLMGFVVNMAQRHHMKDVGYNPERDFAPISMVARAYNILAINPKLPFKSVDELVAYAKSKPGELNAASTGTDLVVELFKQVAGVNIVQIPYKGSAPAASSVVAGDTQMTFGGMVSTLPLVKSGRLRALAITSPQRVQAAPDIPTLAEQGYRGVEASSWYALYAPAGTQRPIIDRLNSEMIKISQEPGFLARLQSQGQESISGSPEELAAFMRAENEKWARLIKAGGFRIEE
jgi:tripartite-type tricarboxylate transporter receptor subunit TctC